MRNFDATDEVLPSGRLQRLLGERPVPEPEPAPAPSSEPEPVPEPEPVQPKAPVIPEPEVIPGVPDGPLPRHEVGPVTIVHGEALVALREMEDNSIDAVITDPPYGLSKAPDMAEVLTHWLNGDDYEHRGGGFMGKQWDSFVPGPSVWREVFRVLKPGGHALVFAGARTQDLMGLSLRLAGFEVRDTLTWLYGCLSEDTEVLTEDGWVRYHEAKEGCHAAAFDPDTGRLQWEPIQQVFTYDHDGPMVRLVSDDTDQLLTLNHRVVLEEGRSSPHAPFVASREDLHDLLGDLPRAGSLPVEAQEDLLAGVRQRGNREGASGQDQAPVGAQGEVGSLLGVRDGGLEGGGAPQADGTGDVLPQVQRGAAGRSVEAARPQGSGCLDRAGRGVLPREDVGVEQPGMEGRGYVIQEAWELLGGPVCAGSAVGTAYGAQGRLHHGASAPDGGAVRVPAGAVGGGQSREPRSLGQPTGEPDTVALQCVPQEVRVGSDGRGGRLPSTPVTASRVDYAGVVWCISVRTGAFVARRNGHMFVTGNSGFPKSMNVSKAIDKAERGVPQGGTDPTSPNHGKFKTQASEGKRGESDKGQGYGGGPGSFMAEQGEQVDREYEGEAAQWEGWGTALKPAYEPIIWVRKPFSVVPLGWRLVADVHHALAGLLWLSLSPAKRAELTSPSSPHALPEGTCVSVLVAAATAPSPDASEATDTYNSPAMASMCSNIATSWSAILDALSDPTTMSTTSTVSNMTTALRILNSLLAPITSQTTMPRCGCHLGGQPSSAKSAESGSSDEWAKWIATLSASAPEAAIEPIAHAVVSALASIVGTPSDGRGEASSAPEAATTKADVSLSPAYEPILMVRKPPTKPSPKTGKPIKATVVETVLEHGTGAINIDATRVGYQGDADKASATPQGRVTSKEISAIGAEPDAARSMDRVEFERPEQMGRWPANVVLTHLPECERMGTRKVRGSQLNQVIERSKSSSESIGAQTDSYCSGYTDDEGTEEVPEWNCVEGCPIAMLDAQTGELTSGKAAEGGHRRHASKGVTGGSALEGNADGSLRQQDEAGSLYGDTGGASRFFYCAKASKSERGAGLEDGRNAHPTVKPIDVMRWLVRMVTPPGGRVLDPFGGSGTTGIAAALEGMVATLIEREPADEGADDYIAIAKARITHHLEGGDDE